MVLVLDLERPLSVILSLDGCLNWENCLSWQKEASEQMCDGRMLLDTKQTSRVEFSGKGHEDAISGEGNKFGCVSSWPLFR